MSDDPRAGFRLIHPLRVRYSEGDMQGIVFNAHYLNYADVAATEYWRELLLAEGQEPGSDMIGCFHSYFGGDTQLRHVEIDFRASAKVDDMLAICTRVTRFGRTSYRTLTHISRDDQLLATVQITYVWFDRGTDMVAPVPQSFIDAVCGFEVSRPEVAR